MNSCCVADEIDQAGLVDEFRSIQWIGGISALKSRSSHARISHAAIIIDDEPSRFTKFLGFLS